MAIQTIKATMQMRYGLEEDLEPDQLTTGEWAVSTNTKYVRMCFRPGLVLRMATYEAFEQDMIEIQTILATCRDIQEAVERFEQLAELHKNDAASSALLSESWAHGETGIREGESEDNSKYWSEQSKSEADRAKEEADRASSIAGYDIDSELNETSTNPVQNKVITKEFNKKLNTDGDASNVLVNFEQSEDRINVASGENLSSFAGKVKKFFFDLKSAAFCDVLESVNITKPGFVMDGRTASEEFSELNRKCFKSVKTSDLNNLNPFEYVTFDYAAGNGISNKPMSNMAGVCYALNNLDGVVQLVFNYDESSNFYIRTSYRDAYSEWRSITTTSIQ